MNDVGSSMPMNNVTVPSTSVESDDHADICPFGDRVWLYDGCWHTSPQCPRMVATTDPNVSVVPPCSECADGVITPYIPDSGGIHLQHELEQWIIDQGANAWPIDRM